VPEIDTNAVYKKLKKQNGEGVAHVMRSAVLLDVPNIVHILEFAGNNPDEVKQLVPVIREIYKTQQESPYHTDKNPMELLNDAGYDAFVVDSLEKQNSIKKYFRPGEELCTFNDPTRYEDYYMIHAVKRGAENIKPATNPERQDEYGTSVISIQIAKTGGFISIKNRYNHTVNDPDATFNNNPDKIIHGLTDSLKKFFHVDFNASENPLPDNFRMVNDQFVRYNYEIDNIYFGSDYYFSGSRITKLNKDYEVMLDYFILDKRSGTVRSVINNRFDCARDVFNHVFQNKKILVKLDKEHSQIFADDVHIATVCDGKIIKLNLPGIDVVGDYFLEYNKALKSIELPNATKIGYNFLSLNKVLTSIELPNTTEIGGSFLCYNEALKSIELPNATEIGAGFLRYNKVLTSIELPNVTEIGYNFLQDNRALKSIELPNATKIGYNFLGANKVLTSIELPNATTIGDNFLYYNQALTSIELPNVTGIGRCFLKRNESLIKMNIPKISPNDNPDIKRLKMVVATNKIKQKRPKSMFAKLLKKSLKTNN